MVPLVMLVRVESRFFHSSLISTRLIEFRPGLYGPPGSPGKFIRLIKDHKYKMFVLLQVLPVLQVQQVTLAKVHSYSHGMFTILLQAKKQSMYCFQTQSRYHNSSMSSWYKQITRWWLFIHGYAR